jgi:hypothetical protein
MIDEKIREALNNSNNALKVQKTVSMLFGVLVRFFLETWVVQMIWNAVISEKLSTPSLGYWDAFLLLVLVRILTGQVRIGGINNQKETKK